MAEREIMMWMIALGEAQGRTWDYESWGFDMEEPPDDEPDEEI